MKPELAPPSMSLGEVHASVATARSTLLRRMLAFAGPAYLVSVGYMDPGNWATDLEGGARFGYRLLWVLLLSNLMAILLQTLSARLGIVAGRDLAQACRDAYPRPICNALWLLCEIAIAACDLAEVLGAAIALNLLFHLPLMIGVVLTALDTFMVLWLARYGIRLIEALVLGLIAIVAGCFIVELVFAQPILREVFSGLLPRIDAKSLYVAVGIIGATVMPHNLYLHSALVQTRRIGTTVAEKRTACRFNLVDSVVALNAALIVNAAILILAAAVFFKHNTVVTEIAQAHELLSPLLGTTLASALFAIALLASGQSSTLTGTLAGQIIMEGFLNLRMRPWMRRLVTRAVAIIPAVITVQLAGQQGTFQLLLLSQVIINMQLPFAIIPLIRFTSDPARMGTFANRGWVKILAWSSAVLIVSLDLWLVGLNVGPWMMGAAWRIALIGPLIVGVVVLLFYVMFFGTRHAAPKTDQPSGTVVAANLPAPVYRKILVPLDHTSRDRAAIAHAAAMARPHDAVLHLLHIEEGVTSQLFGALASTAEIQAGEEYFRGIVQALLAEGLKAELTVTHGRSPREEIVRVARSLPADLVVMGAHGHRGVKDLIFGTTINAVRHAITAPVLVVGDVPET
ncbi:MAG TPA: Nramp family divalent metal transporter [Bryobacteraceae bacterium]|nr:Nramp family divalent metal transporter [Bryobacteraceae bacterium]